MKVPPRGNPDSKIMLIGEAPGREEDLHGVPFVGPAGKLLDTVLGEVGLSQEDCYVTNVLQTRPPNSNFLAVSQEHISIETARLRREILNSKANVLVPLGANALHAVIPSKQSITDWRGSVLPAVVLGAQRKVIPTIHPAAALRNWVPYRQMLSLDFKRILHEMDSSEIPNTKRESIRPRTLVAVRRVVLEMDRDPSKLMSIDIEADKKTHIIQCISFAISINKAYSIPLLAGGLQDPSELDEVQNLVRYLLVSPNPKVMQNGCNFDIPFLTARGYPVTNWAYDTFCMAHCLYVELPRTLAFLTSVYTKQPFYKFMLKDAVAGGRMNWDTLAAYNCLDAMVTLEIAEKQILELEKRGLAKFYDQFYTQLFPVLLEAEMEGVRLNVGRRAEVAKEIRGERDEVAEQLVGTVGNLHGFELSKNTKKYTTICDKVKEYESSGKSLKKNGEPKQAYLNWLKKQDEFQGEQFNPSAPTQVAEVLYGRRGYGLRARRHLGKVTTNDEALNKIIRSYKTPLETRQFCEQVLTYRGVDKLITTYLESEVDRDGRVRCTYNIGVAKTGRLSSEKNVFGTGFNLQNIPKRKGRSGLIRSLFLPDEGDVFVSADLSQAEARVVAWLAGEESLMQKFNDGEDVFNFVASQLFNVLESEVTPEQRQMAKVIRHGTNYGMSTDKFAYTAGLDTASAERLFLRDQMQFPKLVRWRENTRQTVDTTRCLTTPLGRFRRFYDRVKYITRLPDGSYNTQWNEEYLRDAFSWVPQSTVGDLLNLGLISVHNTVITTDWGKYPRPRFRLQVHDEVIFSCKPACVEQLTEVLKHGLEILIVINTKELKIPAKITVGKDWSEV